MKKVAFFVQHMLCGGVETSLINLIKSLPSDYEVFIYVIKKNGDLIDVVSNIANLNLIPMNERVRNNIPVGGIKVATREEIYKKKYYTLTKMILKHIFSKNNYSEININFNRLEEIDCNFDIAVCYHMHSPFLVKYVSEKVKAKRKIAWIHNDFKSTRYDLSALNKELYVYDKFYVVSRELENEFIELYPTFREKVSVFYNIILKDEIKKMAYAESVYDMASEDNVIKLLTVGRLEEQKGYLMALEVCKVLVENKFKFKWYVIGEGTQRKILENKIKEYYLEDKFILLGAKKNPYPYYKESDIYVQPSIHEGYGIAVAEARALYKPIVCTNFIGALDQIVNDENGIIVDKDVNEIAQAIIRLSKSEDLKMKFVKKLKVESLENECGEINL